MVVNLEYYLNQLTLNKVDFDKEKLTNWLSDVSYCLCKEMKVPTTAYNFRVQEEERILARATFAAQQIYATEEEFYAGLDLDKTIDLVPPDYMARRILNGDSCPFKAPVDMNK